MKTLILTVGDRVTPDAAITALTAAGLQVEQRQPIAYYVDPGDAVKNPIYSYAEYMKSARHITPAELLGMAANLACDGYANIIDDVHLKGEQRDAIRAELGEILTARCADGITLAGFVAGNALRPLFLVDGVTVQGDLSQTASSRFEDHYTLGSAVDAAHAVTIELTVENLTGRIRADRNPLVL